MNIDAILDRCLLDPEFRARLISQPRATLEAFGIAVPPSVEILVSEGNSASRQEGAQLHLVLPSDEWAATPSVQELERSVPEWGMSVCSKSYSCCCGHSDPIEENPPAMAA